MIVVRMIGGLGNQLFQYAAARALAAKHGACVRVDLSWYATQTERRYQLDEFCVQTRAARAWDYLRVNAYLGMSRILEAMVGKRLPMLSSWLTRKSGRTDVFGPSVGDGANRKLLDKGLAFQRFFHFDADFFDLPDNVYLSGFWQSYRYFDHVRKQILREIVLRRPMDRDGLALLSRITTSNSVSVHIRRGDKVSNADYNATDIEYVLAAARAIEQRIEQPVFFVFTDDLDWVIGNLAIEGEVVYVGTQVTMTDCEELMLMSNCKHNIIAESSFSWWAAWLNPNPGKVVISPPAQRWINADDYYKHDLLPETWLVVDGNVNGTGIDGDERKACR